MLPSSSSRLMEKLFVKLLAFFSETTPVKRHIFQDIQQGVYLSFGGVEPVDNDDLLILQYTVTRLEITLLITQSVIRFRDHFFKFGQKLVGVFNHISCAILSTKISHICY